MARLDVQEYRDKYLRQVEDRIMAKKESVPHYTTHNLHEAVMEEMNRADVDTWQIEVPDDKETALKEAEERIIETMRQNVDLGVGKGGVASKP
jgi:hypothetical protein